MIQKKVQVKMIPFTTDVDVILTGIGKQRLDEYEKEINQRLPFILRQKKFKRHTKEELPPPIINFWQVTPGIDFYIKPNLPPSHSSIDNK